MPRFAPLRYASPLNHLMTFLFLWLFCLLITLAVIKGLGQLVWHSNLFDLAANPDFSDPTHMLQLRFIQIANQLGTMILPPLLLALLVSSTPMRWLTLSRKPSLFSALLVVALTFAIYPLVEMLANWNMGMSLPESLSRLSDMMQRSEESATELTEAFLLTSDAGNLAANILMVGLLAALGEELLFRPAIINIMGRWMNNYHVAVIISAVLFAALHLQFFTFLPRLVLGLILGYLYVWTGTVWVPFITHLFYNSIAVVAYFLIAKGSIEVDPEHLFQTNAALLYAGSALATAIILWFVKQKEARGRTSSLEIDETAA